MREEQDYNQYHIKESISFPQTHLNRDKFPATIYSFKNKEDKMIIFYHLDEKASIPLGQLLFEKGFNNIFLLTGGVEDFIKDHRDLVEGKDIPIF